MAPYPVVGLFQQQSAATTARGRPPKQKIIKREVDEIMNIGELTDAGYQSSQNARPSVEIMSCISYQKFRYSGENRPGKKYQEKDFMELKLSNLGDKVVRVVIICTDADNKELIHPNGLVGKDCHDGIYDKEYPITTHDFNIKIPYLRTERIKTKKNELSKIRDILKSRAEHLPSPYRERCESQCTADYTYNRKFDTTKVCLGVIVTVRSHYQGAVNGSLHAISHVVNNASEKTALNILKLSNDIFSVTKGGWVDVFTTEDGPAIENDKYFLHVSYEDEGGNILWESEKVSPAKREILYKRIISYQVPPIKINVDDEHTVEASLHLECPQSNQSCECPIYYSNQGPEYMLYDTQTQKRSFTEELDDIKPSKRLRLSDKQNSDVKAVLKDTLKRREDGRRNSLPPAVEIVQRYTDGALVRRPDSHAVPDTIDENIYHENHSSPSPDQSNQEFQVLAAAYSNSVPSDTVLIITNDGIDDDIENAINKGVSYFEKPMKGRGNNEMIIIDPSTNEVSRQMIESSSPPKENCQVVVEPDSKTAGREIHSSLNKQSGKISQFSQDNVNTRVIQSTNNKPSDPPVTSKKSLKTDSPWAVGSDDESDEAMNIFNELSYNKQKNSLQNSQNKTDNSEKVVLVEGQKTISILSSKGDAMGKVINSKEQVHPTTIQLHSTSRQELDFSTMHLPSELTLNSEVLANYDLVKEISSSDLKSQR